MDEHQAADLWDAQYVQAQDARTPLSPEEAQAVREAGVAWCSEPAFERIFAALDAARAENERLRALLRVYEAGHNRIEADGAYAVCRCETCARTREALARQPAPRECA